MSLFDPASTDANTPLVGTSGPDTLRGTTASESLYGQEGNDRLYGNGGNDFIHGGLGRDTLKGGAGADVFVFNNLSESYEGGGVSHSDLIVDFFGVDRIDVSAMGFTGLGDGHNHTLRVEINDEGTRTYLKSYAYGEDGNRFQLALDGDVSQYLTQDRIVFAGTDQSLAAVTGTAGPDVLRGDNVSENIRGGGGNDHIYGNGGADVISGGLGRDVLEGGAGADTFVYSNITESYEGGGTSFSDLIVDFTGNDRIDVAALGFIGLGNGHDHTLRIEVNDAGTRTYLKSYAYGEDGNRFQLAFDGDVSQYLSENSIVFAGTDAATAGGLAVPSTAQEAVIEPLGIPHHDMHGTA